MAATHPALRDDAWALIEAHGADRAALASALAALDADALVRLGAHVIVARNLVRARDDGPEIEGYGRLDPLSTEELTEWVVLKGRRTWRSCVGAPDRVLQRLHAQFLADRTPQLLGEIFGAHAAKEAGAFDAALDAYFARLDAG